MHQVAKVLEFQLWHQSFNEYSGLISFRMDWLDLLAVQGGSGTDRVEKKGDFWSVYLMSVPHGLQGLSYSPRAGS